MRKLIPIHKKLFAQDFNSGFDGIIRQMIHTFGLESLVEIVLSVQEADRNWRNLRLRIYGVKAFEIRGEPKSYQMVFHLTGLTKTFI